MRIRRLTFHRAVAAMGMTLLCGGCCDREGIPKQKQQLYSSSAHDRNEAALSLARCGSAADSAVLRLSDLLYDENVGVQSSAAYALRKIDTPAARAVLQRAEARRKK